MYSRIVIHATGTTGGESLSLDEIRDMRAEADPRQDPMPYHYVIDVDGRIMKGKRDSQLCGHCGRFSRNSLSIAYVGGIAATEDNTSADSAALRDENDNICGVETRHAASCNISRRAAERAESAEEDNSAGSAALRETNEDREYQHTSLGDARPCVSTAQVSQYANTMTTKQETALRFVVNELLKRNPGAEVIGANALLHPDEPLEDNEPYFDVQRWW